jgi:hypothetical protein
VAFVDEGSWAVVDLVSGLGGGGALHIVSGRAAVVCVMVSGREDKGESVPDDKRENEKITERVCATFSIRTPFSTNQIVEFSCPQIVCFLCTVNQIESNGSE